MDAAAEQPHRARSPAGPKLPALLFALALAFYAVLSLNVELASSVVSPLFAFFLPGFPFALLLLGRKESSKLEVILASFLISLLFVAGASILLALLGCYSKLSLATLLLALVVAGAAALLFGGRELSLDANGKERWALCFALAAYLANLFFGLAVPWTPAPDEVKYLSSAAKLAFSSELPSFPAYGNAAVNFLASRGVWATLISAVLVFTGPRLSYACSSAFYLALMLACYAVALNATGSRKAAAIAMLLAAISPVLQIWGASLLTEMALASLYVTAYHFFLKSVRFHEESAAVEGFQLKHLTLSAAALLLSIAIKPVLIVPALLYLALVFLVSRSSMARKNFVLRALLVLAVVYFLVVELPWLIPPQAHEVPFLGGLRRQAMYLCAAKFFRNAFPMGPLMSLEYFEVSLLSPLVYTGPVVVLALAGLLSSAKSSGKERFHVLFCATALVVYSAFVAVLRYPHAVQRQMVAALPFMLLLASYGFAKGIEKRFRGFLLATLAALSAIAALELSMFWTRGGINLSYFAGPVYVSSLELQGAPMALAFYFVLRRELSNQPLRIARKLAIGRYDALLLILLVASSALQMGLALYYSPYHGQDLMFSVVSWLEDNAPLGAAVANNYPKAFEAMLPSSNFLLEEIPSYQPLFEASCFSGSYDYVVLFLEREHVARTPSYNYTRYFREDFPPFLEVLFSTEDKEGLLFGAVCKPVEARAVQLWSDDPEAWYANRSEVSLSGESGIKVAGTSLLVNVSGLEGWFEVRCSFSPVNVSEGAFAAVFFYGAGTGAELKLVLWTSSPGSCYQLSFTDDFQGWRRIYVPLGAAEKAGLPGEKIIGASLIGFFEEPISCTWYLDDLTLVVPIES